MSSKEPPNANLETFGDILKRRLGEAMLARRIMPPNPLPRYDEVFFQGSAELFEEDMNPDTNKLEPLTEDFNIKVEAPGRLLRPDGSEVPSHWSVFQVGEQVVVKDYTFKVAYIGEGTLLLEPVAPVVFPGPPVLNLKDVP